MSHSHVFWVSVINLVGQGNERGREETLTITKNPMPTPAAATTKIMPTTAHHTHAVEPKRMRCETGEKSSTATPEEASVSVGVDVVAGVAEV